MFEPFAQLEDCFAELGLPKPEDETLRQAWTQAQRDFDWLTLLAEVSAGGKEAVHQKELCETFQFTIKQIGSWPALQRLAWFQYKELSETPWQRGSGVKLWPRLPEHMFETVPLFDAVVLLACVPSVRRFHRERGIPDEVSLDTLSDLELWIHEEKRQHGCWAFRQRGWLSNHFSGRLYKLGRLQFETHPFHFRFHAFRHRTDRRVAVFAAQGQRFRADGYFDGVNDRRDADGFESLFACDTRRIRGTYIEPARGVARREPVELDAAEWACILGEHDPCLGVHIPATGPMTADACGESFHRAREFFPRHFPERRFAAFTCTSWLLDAQFEDYLKPESNIVQFFREWYLFPKPGASDFQHLERAFDNKFDRVNLDANEQKSSVHRAIVQHMKAGKDWIMGGGLVFPHNLDWGQQVYRKMAL